MRTEIFLVMVGVIGFGLSVSAATINVTTTDPAVAADGQCSLIEAIVNANNDGATHADCPAGSGADVIELASSAVYELDTVNISFEGPNGFPIISSEITVEGHASTIRRAAGAPEFRFFAVNSSGNLRLNDLMVRGGDASASFNGGALLNELGTVELSRTTVTENTAWISGGLHNRSGAMTLTDCVVSLNVATGGGGGIFSIGGVANAMLEIHDTLVTGNTVLDGGGGGVYSLADGSQATVIISGSEITDNTAARTTGGVRSAGSTVQISDSTVDGNHGGWSCGGVFIGGGVGDIDRTTISNNTVDNTIDYGTGGGLCVSDNTTTVTNSTISGNQVLGPSSGQLYSGRGGGISVIGGAFDTMPDVDTVVIVEDSTVSNNTAELVGGGISVYRVAGTMAVELELRNTIVAENLEGGGALLGNCVEASPAVINSSDFNLTDDVTCNLVGTDDLVVADVMLASLADNGGPTMTHLPEAGSSAIDTGDDALCPEFDQRGYVRPWDGDADGFAHCDRGAVELGAPFFYGGFETGDTNGWSNTMP